MSGLATAANTESRCIRGTKTSALCKTHPGRSWPRFIRSKAELAGSPDVAPLSRNFRIAVLAPLVVKFPDLINPLFTLSTLAAAVFHWRYLGLKWYHFVQLWPSAHSPKTHSHGQSPRLTFGQLSHESRPPLERRLSPCSHV